MEREKNSMEQWNEETTFMKSNMKGQGFKLTQG